MKTNNKIEASMAGSAKCDSLVTVKKMFPITSPCLHVLNMKKKTFWKQKLAVVWVIFSSSLMMVKNIHIIILHTLFVLKHFAFILLYLKLGIGTNKQTNPAIRAGL